MSHTFVSCLSCNVMAAVSKTKDSKKGSTVTSAVTEEAHYSTKEGLVRFAIHLCLLLPFLMHLQYTGNAIYSCPDRKRVFEFAMQFGGRWKFLTVINQTILLVHLIVACVTDIVPIPRFKKAVWTVTDVLFTSVVFPTSMNVAVYFWGMFNYDRELVYPPIMDLCVPAISNHGMHTLPLIIVLIEMLVVFHRFPSRSMSFLLLFVFSGIYNCWVLIVYNQTGRWVYPFMKMFTPLTFTMFCLSSTFVSFVFHLVGRLCASTLWKGRLEEIEKLKQN